MVEHAAAARSGQIADRPTRLALDCKAVIGRFVRPRGLFGSNCQQPINLLMRVGLPRSYQDGVLVNPSCEGPLDGDDKHV
eukprot:2038891-Pyramimonas_sp.AAC.1